MRFLLVAAGTPPRHLAELVEAGPWDVVVAVDGGADALLAIGRVPDVMIGDLDSAVPETVGHLRVAGVPIHQHPAAKDDTDLALAIDHAIKAGATEVVMAAATGSRLDHSLANLQLLVRIAARNARGRLEEDGWRVWGVSAAHPLTWDAEPGDLVSVLPLTDPVTGLDQTGLEWPLAGASMRPGHPYGVSNRAVGGPVSVKVTAGVAAVMTPLRS